MGYRQVVRHQLLVLTFSGSNPDTPSILMLNNNSTGEVGEWSNPTDCKSVAYGFEGSSPSLPTI